MDTQPKWYVRARSVVIVCGVLAFIGGVNAHAQQSTKSAPCCKIVAPAAQPNAEIIASGLAHPWAVAFLPNGDALVTERDGALRALVASAALSSGRTAKPYSVFVPISGLPRISVVGQDGTVVMRARLVKANRGGDSPYRLENIRAIFRAEPKSRRGVYFGSRFAFAEDGTLFVTLGERGNSSSVQDPGAHHGSVVRINTGGSAPDDNPFVSGETVSGTLEQGKKTVPELWSMGHHNAQGAFVHPRTGELWVMEHGAKGGDELNIVHAGKNYGWPLLHTVQIIREVQ